MPPFRGHCCLGDTNSTQMTLIKQIKKKPPQSSLSRSTCPSYPQAAVGELKEYKHYSQANRLGI